MVFTKAEAKAAYKDIVLVLKSVLEDSVSSTMNAAGQARSKEAIKSLKEARYRNDISYKDLILSIDVMTDTGRVVFQLV